MSPAPLDPATGRPAPGAAATMPTPVATTDSCVLAIVGSGGDGVALLGDLLLRMAAEQGIYGMMVQSYGARERSRGPLWWHRCRGRACGGTGR